MKLNIFSKNLTNFTVQNNLVLLQREINSVTSSDISKLNQLPEKFTKQLINLTKGMSEKQLS